MQSRSFKKQSTWRQFIFHPVSVLATSLLTALIFAGFIIWRYEGETRWFLLYYFVPIGIPFVTFLFDRLERHETIHPVARGIDLIVMILSLTRSVIHIPFFSGHALFLSYAMLTMRSTTARITAAIVMLEVAYLKIFVWQDATLLGGIAIGCLAALVYRGFFKNKAK